MSIYLVEFDAHDGVSVTRHRYATEGYTTRSTDSPPNTYYTPRIVDPGNFQRSLFSGGTTRGQSSVGRGDIIFVNGKPYGYPETIDFFTALGVHGRFLSIKRLANRNLPLSAAETLFVGRCNRFTSGNVLEQIALEIYDRLTDLDKPLLTTRYLGTTLSSGPTAEGTEDLKGQIKQRLYGGTAHIQGVLVNPYNLLYQFSDSPLVSLQLYDGGLPLAQDADDANLASLIAPNIAPGRYRTCLALGIARPGILPQKVLTADAVEGSQASSRTAPAIVRRALLAFGISSGDLPATSFDVLHDKNPAPCQILVTGEQTALSFCAQVLDSVGGYLVTNTLDQFEVGRLETPAEPPVAEFDQSQILRDSGSEIERLPLGDEGGGTPVPQVIIRWGRNWHVQGANDVFPSVTASRRLFLASEFREELSAIVAAVTTKYPNANPITIDTCFVSQLDAAAEGTRKLAMHSVERDRYQFRVDVGQIGLADIAKVVRLTMENDRLSLGLGKLFATLGRTDEYVENKITLDVWGGV